MSKLIYRTAAKKWKEALPLGNGTLAAMVFGGIREERIALNDATLWSGYPRDYTNPDSLTSLDEARRLIFSGDFAKADQFVMRHMQGDYSESFLPLGNLFIETNSTQSPTYRRCLDLETAVFTVDNGEETREAFVSYPAGALYYRLTFRRPTNLRIAMTSKLKAKARAVAGNISLRGHAPDRVIPNYRYQELYPVRYNEGKGMAFAALCEIETDGKKKTAGREIKILQATQVLLRVTSETGFRGYDKMPERDSAACLTKLLRKSAECGKDFERARAEHIADHTAIYGRHSLVLGAEHLQTESASVSSGGGSENLSRSNAEIVGENATANSGAVAATKNGSTNSGADEDTLSLLSRAKSGRADTALVNLLYDYGKYLTIAGSRDGQPLNLQGIWNESVRPPWSGNLTTNINFEMNYWGAAACNLDACLAPFYHAVSEIAESGKKTAQVNYGAGGFACNHNVDVWRMTTPVKGNPAYMYAPFCGVWLANEAFAHQITTFGKPNEEIKKIMRDAIAFCFDSLTLHDGKLTTCPSASPEAEFLHGGKRCALDHSSAFETGIIMQCFDHCYEISDDEEEKKKIDGARQLLFGFTKTSTGLNEWHGEAEIAERGHRHFSPLYALYPGKVIGYYGGGARLADAAELFDYRMAHAHSSIGWSAAWAICLAARLHRGEEALDIIRKMLSRSLFPNLFGYHPPTYFQIDGNLGFVAGVNEMLVYEEDGVIDLLPACPSEWRAGSVTGHKVRGATVDFAWEDGSVVRIVSDLPIRVDKNGVAKGAVLVNVTLTER